MRLNLPDTESVFDRTIRILIYLFIVFSLFTISGTQIAFGLIMMAWTFRMIKERKWLVHATSMDIPFLLFTAVCILSTVFSLHPAESFSNLKQLLLLIVVYIIASNLDDERYIETGIDVFVITATTVAMLGILTTDIIGGKRIKLLQDTTMTWGAISAVFSLISLSLFLFLSGTRKRWLYLGAFCIQFGSMLFSYVRGSWVGFIAGVLFLASRKKKLAFALVLLIIVSFLIVPPALKDRILSVTDLSVHSTQVRFEQWRNSVKIIGDHPIVGVGWIDLTDLHRQYAPPDADLTDHAYHIGHFHNNFIMLLVYFGVIGFSVAVFMFFRMYRAEHRTMRVIPREKLKLRSWVMGSMAALTAFLVNGIFDFTFGDAEPMTMIWLTLGICLAIRRLYTSETGESS